MKPSTETVKVSHPTLIALLRERALSEPDRACVGYAHDGETDEVRWSHADLDARARAVAVALAAHAKHGDRVLCVYPPGLDFFAGFYGAVYAGAVAVPAPPPNPAQLAATLPRLVAIMADAAPRVVLATKALVDALPLLARHAPALASVPWIATDDASLASASAWREPDVGSRAVAYLQYTSGSTAAAKGVIVQHQAILVNLAQTVERFRVGRDGSSFMWLPTFHNFGLVFGFLQGLYDGFPGLFMSPLAFLERPGRWLRALSRVRAASTGAPNFAYELCARAVPESECADLDLSNLAIAGCGAEPIREASLRTFADRFRKNGFRFEAFKPGYGLSEATAAASMVSRGHEPRVVAVSARALGEHRVEIAERESEGARTLVGNGSPYVGSTMLIVDAARGEEAAEGRIGEIWILGPHVSPGYWNRPEESAATFGARLADGRGPFLRTGDLGFLHEGELYITGRSKDLIIQRGHNHYAQDLEATVERSHPAVRPFGVAAFAVEIAGEERAVVALEVDPRGAPLDAEGIIAAARQALAREHQVQAHGVVLLAPGALPRTASNKMQRRACRDAYEKGTLPALARSELAVAPTSATPAPGPAQLTRAALVALPEGQRIDALASFVSDTVAAVSRTPRERVHAETALASLGLDSLMVVQLKHALEVALEHPIPIVTLLEGPPIGAFARALYDHAATMPAGAAMVARGDEAAATLTNVETLAERVALDASIAAHGRAYGHVADPTDVLLTGATGSVGAFLLAELLRATKARVHCLVRAHDAEAGRARLLAAARRHVELREADLARVEVVIGDLERPRLGLEARTYAALAEQVQWIFHSGARVNFVYPYAALEAANVGGTREVLRLAATGPLKAVHFLSTVGVLMSGAYLDGDVAREDAPLARTGQLTNGYEQTKWVADALVALARERGVPAVTYRVGLATGDGRTGRYEKLDEFLPRMLKGCIQLGVAPALAGETILVPVDYLARAMVKLAGDARAQNRVLHLNHPRPLTIREMIAWIDRRGYRQRALPFGAWRREAIAAIVDRGERDNALAGYLDYLVGLQEHQAATPVMDYANARALLGDLPCDDLEVLLGRYFDCFVERGFLPPPPRTATTNVQLDAPASSNWT